jgi:hypothetical protein
VKYQDIYLKAYGSMKELKDGLKNWFGRYDRRRHRGLDAQTPDVVCWRMLPQSEGRNANPPSAGEMARNLRPTMATVPPMNDSIAEIPRAVLAHLYRTI